MHPNTRTVQWVGGPQDGALVAIPYDATWVAVLEDRRNTAEPKPEPGTAPRSLQRYSVPVIDHKIVWSQRVEANPEDQP
jgi:hypothetical protein